MNKKTKNHTIDIVFVIVLFSCFAISILMITGMGASVYQNIVDNMTVNYNTRTSYSYIVNKVHQSDENGNITVGTFNGQAALIINEEIDNIAYCTYMYYYDGYLKELFTRKGQDFDPSYGNDILELDDFKIEKITDSLIKFEITPADGNTQTIFTHTRTN